jgi:hypothetical protein
MAAEPEPEPIEAEPAVIIDTTAELLGRRPKRARTRTAAAPRRPAVKKAAPARRVGRTRKQSSDGRDDSGKA